MLSSKITKIARNLSQDVNAFLEAQGATAPWSYAYNPLDYASIASETYIKKYADSPKNYLFLGMNPGPFGMAQTGVPFGDIPSVRDWLGVCTDIGKPPQEHPKRIITGFDCPRREVSGTRLWSWAKERFSSPEKFFKTSFIWNYCPLVFMSETGANITPDKLPKELRDELFLICDEALLKIASTLEVDTIIGIGKFARKRAEKACPEFTISDILHPSPASPKANKDWSGTIEKQLTEIGFLAA